MKKIEKLISDNELRITGLGTMVEAVDGVARYTDGGSRVITLGLLKVAQALLVVASAIAESKTSNTQIK